MAQVLVAKYTVEFVFKIPKGVTLTPENHRVRGDTLYITLEDETEIEIEASVEYGPDYKYPLSTKVEPAEDWDLMDEDE